MVASERPARSVGAVFAGSQADNKQTGLHIAEWWHGSTIISRMFAPYLPQMSGKSLASRALFVEPALIRHQ